jgi:ribosomal protein L7/L12
MHESQLVDNRCVENRQTDVRFDHLLQLQSLSFQIQMLNARERQVNRIKAMQEILKCELREAKQRLGVADHKWSYDCK